MLFLNCALKQLIQLQINQMAQSEQSLFFLEQASLAGSSVKCSSAESRAEREREKWNMQRSNMFFGQWMTWTRSVRRASARERVCGLGNCVWVFTARMFLWFYTNLLNELLEGNCPVGEFSVHVRVFEVHEYGVRADFKGWNGGSDELCVCAGVGQIWPTLWSKRPHKQWHRFWECTGSLCALGLIWHG